MEDRSIYFCPAHSQFLSIFLSFRFVFFKVPQRYLMRIVHVSFVFDCFFCCFIKKLMRSFLSSRDVVIPWFLPFCQPLQIVFFLWGECQPATRLSPHQLSTCHHRLADPLSLNPLSVAITGQIWLTPLSFRSTVYHFYSVLWTQSTRLAEVYHDRSALTILRLSCTASQHYLSAAA